MFMFPFVAAVADAVSVIIDKIALGKQRLPLKHFIPLLFIFLFILTSILVPFLGGIDYEMAIQEKYLFFFGLMIALAVTWNIFYYQSIQKEKLHEHEMIIMLFPAVTILLASILLPGEYDRRIFIASMAAAGALAVSRLEGGHFKFNQYSINLVVAVMLMATEILIIKELLKVYSPVSLYALRTGVLGLFFILYYRPKLKDTPRESVLYVLASAGLGALFMILRFYGYKDLGVVHTTLILIMSPFLVYLASAKFFGEKIKLRAKVAAIIIMICITYVTIVDALPN